MKYFSQERSFHAAVVVGENIIIVGSTDIYIEHILNKYKKDGTDIYFEHMLNRYKKGGTDRRQTSKWFREVPTDTDSSASTNTGEIVKSE